MLCSYVINFETISGMVQRQSFVEVCNSAEARGRQLKSLYTRFGSTEEDEDYTASSSRYPTTIYQVLRRYDEKPGFEKDLNRSMSRRLLRL